MTEHLISSQFEKELRAALAVPGPRPEFLATLRNQLQAAAGQKGKAVQGRRWRPAQAALLVLLVLVVALLAIGPQRVLAQVRDWLGYVPGVGFVQTERGLRVLEAPVSVEREGITLTVRQGLVDDQTTYLTILFEGIRPEQLPSEEALVGCFERPYILLPDGSELANDQGSGSSGHTWLEMELRYAALPEDVNDVTLVAPCVRGTLPDSAPEDWRLQLHFVPAPEDFNMLSVLPLPTDPAPAETETSQASDGLKLSVENLVEIEGGYLFQVRFSWEDSAYEYVAADGFELSMTDADGVEQPIGVEVDRAAMVAGAREAQWEVSTQTRRIASPVTISLPRASVPVTFEDDPAAVIAVDLGKAPSAGQSWPINQAFDVLDGAVELLQARLEDAGDGTYLIHLELQLDTDKVLVAHVEDIDNQSEFPFGGGGGGGSGQASQAIGYDYLPEGVHHFQLDMASEIINGPWQATVGLPRTEGGESTGIQAACLTADTYAALLAGKPSELSEPPAGRVLTQEFSTQGAMLPTLYVQGLDGSQKQSIDIGSWGALSPDGRMVAYAHDGLQVVDLKSGIMHTLIEEDSAYAMAWAPDNSRLAFIRGGQGLYLINADGSGLQPSPGGSADMIGVAGWLDEQHVVVARIAPDGSQVQTVDVESGEVVEDLLIDNRKGGFTHLSPNGHLIAFSEQGIGAPTYGVYVANLDDSDKRLLAQPSDAVAFEAGAWSADGQWLILSATQLGVDNPQQAPVLLNVDSCQAYLLEGLMGEVVGWAP